MNERLPFNPLQAQEVAQAFNAAGVDYLFIGKSGAILLGYPGTTQDVHLFPARSEDNGRRMIPALLGLGFALDENTQAEIIRGKDFIQLKNGPFDLDLVFAPDGIEDYDQAKNRMDKTSGLPVLNIRDIIASKRAAARPKDAVELPLLEAFREEYEKHKRTRG